MKKGLPTICAILLLNSNQTSTASDTNNAIQRLTNAYKSFIAKVTKNNMNGEIYVHMTNGRIIPWQDKSHKTFEEKLASSSLADMTCQNYPINPDIDTPPAFNHDPGRFRNDAFFQSIYGNTASAVEKNLVKVQWLPETTKQRGEKPICLLFNKQNGAAAALKKVSQELDRLPASLKKYLLPPAGTFVWRKIAGTDRYSPHSYGIAIDISTTYSNYWRWNCKDNKNIQFQNQIPAQIVSIFERNGFIWGGRWYHHDTMHFEYRPEYFNALKTKNKNR